MCKQTTQGRSPASKMKSLRTILRLTGFYDHHFAPLLPAADMSPVTGVHIFEYSVGLRVCFSFQVVTIFENNVNLDYVEYVEFFVNAFCQQYDLVPRIRRTRKTKT